MQQNTLCHTSVLQMAACLGRHLDAFVPGLFGAAMRLLAAQLEARAAAASGQPAPIEYDRDLLVSALDLVSGLAEGLGASMDPLVACSPLAQVSESSQWADGEHWEPAWTLWLHAAPWPTGSSQVFTWYTILEQTSILKAFFTA